MLALILLLLCSLAAPAFATPHSGVGKKSQDKSVLFDRHDNGLHLGWITWSARLDMRELLRQERDRRHAALMAWLRSHRKPSGGEVGGGTTLPPVATPPGGTQVPMPEPGAALLFALGTGMVALYMRRPQAA